MFLDAEQCVRWGFLAVKKNYHGYHVTGHYRYKPGEEVRAAVDATRNTDPDDHEDMAGCLDQAES
jgi:hypothetical protein